MFEGAWTSRPFHGDEWLFSSVLLPSYEKGDLVIGRLYEAIKNVCQSAVSNAIPKREREGGRGAGMVKRPFTVTLNSSLTALLYLSDNALVVKMIFILLFFFFFFLPFPCLIAYCLQYENASSPNSLHYVQAVLFWVIVCCLTSKLQWKFCFLFFNMFFRHFVWWSMFKKIKMKKVRL